MEFAGLMFLALYFAIMEKVEPGHLRRRFEETDWRAFLLYFAAFLAVLYYFGDLL